MKKIFLSLLIVVTIFTSAFADDIKVINEDLVSNYQIGTTEVIGTEIDLSKYKIIRLGIKADEELIIYNYSGNPDSFEVLCLFSEDNEQEWVQAAKTGEILPVKEGKKKGYKTPYDLDDKCRRCDEICELVAIRTKTGNEYNYNIYTKSDKLYIEVKPYLPEAEAEMDW